MSEQTTYIKLDRKIIGWEWYKDVATFKVFVHLLLKASYRETAFMGVRIHRGCAVASYKSLAEETGLGIGQVRTALGHLKKTGEIEATHHRTFSVYKIVNYAEYQNCKEKKKQPLQNQPKPTPNPLGVYGVNNNVKLTDEEYVKLKTDFVDADGIINRVSVWLSEGTHSKARKHYNLCVKFAGDKSEKDDPRATKRNADGTFIQDGYLYRLTEDGVPVEIGKVY